jgi:aspartate carbamoyltransferase catalytic subunit
VLAFFEDSTRTRASFDLAARRLSADVATFAAGSSSLSKGESLRDTVETITAMGVDAIVVRHPHPGAPLAIARFTTAAVINAGDGRHQHPTQALLDAYTLREALGDIEGRRILLCGDILNSRVARSNITMFTKLGAEVIVCGPHTLLPPHSESEMFGVPVEIVDDLDSVIPTIDVAYMLRIQHERIGDAALPTIREYRSVYGLTAARADRLPPHAVVMHPGPMNRGVEIDPDVADSERSLITSQVANGVSTRMAVLYELLGPGQFDDRTAHAPGADFDLTDPDGSTVEDARDVAEEAVG